MANDSPTSNPATSPVLKPCPFCGGLAGLDTVTARGGKSVRWEPHCKDKRCMAYRTSKTFETPELAAIYWNRRAPETPSNNDELIAIVDTFGQTCFDCGLIRDTRDVDPEPTKLAQKAARLAVHVALGLKDRRRGYAPPETTDATRPPGFVCQNPECYSPKTCHGCGPA